MDTPKTRTIKVTFLDTTSIQYIEIAVVTYGDKRELRYNLIILYNNKIYKIKPVWYSEWFIESAFENIIEGYYHRKDDLFNIISPTHYITLRHDSDKNDEIKTYIRKHGLFEETNEYVLK